jgi:spore coat protein U-like protein
MKQQLRLLLIIFLFPSFFVCAANDQTLQSSASEIKIEVVNGCMLNNVTSGFATLGTLNFGDIYKSNVITDAQTSSGNGNIELRCTPGTTAKITMGAGLYGSSVSNRKMRLTAGVTTLNYQIYTSSNRQTVWDDTVGVSVTFNSDVTQSIPIYGRVPVQATPTSGTYTDQIILTVSY